MIHPNQLRHSFRRRFLPLALSLFCLPGGLLGQNPAPLLDQYIQEALASNHIIKQKQFQINKSLAALAEAKRLFFPEVNFGVSYTLAAGGRKISFPVGDLLNGVYSTLNQLTNSQSFPQLENVNEQFLPNNFYDARVRATQPILNAEIKLNRLIKSAQVGVQEADLQVYRRELVKEVKVAYFQYLQASEALNVYRNALELLQESKRVNESLVKNDKAIPSVITRSNSEIAGVQAQLTGAANQQQNAAAYFNFLLNRPLDAAIARDSTFALPTPPNDASGVQQREELVQLNQLQTINSLVVQVEEAYRRPKLGAQLDVGSQAFNFGWGGYALLGINLEIPLYTANRNKLQVQQATLENQALQAQIRQVEQQIQLQVHTARNTWEADRQIWASYQIQESGAQQYYRDVLRRYREGVASYIELLDARTQLTTVAIQRTLAFFTVLIRQTEWERAVGAYSLN